MKFLVETNGDYALHDLIGRQTLEAYRPTVVTNTPFIEVHRGTKLTVLETLADDASDEALAKASTAEDLEKAIAALPRPKADGVKADGAKGKAAKAAG